MATHSSVLAWRIPGKGEPGLLPSMGWHRIGHDWSNLAAAATRMFWSILRASGTCFLAAVLKPFKCTLTVPTKGCYLISRTCPRLLQSPGLFSLQAPLSMGFTRQEYWSKSPFPLPGNFPDPGIEPLSPALAGRFFTVQPPGKPTKGWHLPFMFPKVTSKSAVTTDLPHPLKGAQGRDQE